ncbi:MAG: dTDP-4-dehydrorhamnose reductase [Saccharospirillum sp.]|nr:dTDP-4-dehydrorhamnose reductase [Saccharospirillum sp.]
MTKTILITGTTGQVGHELKTLLEQSNPNHQLLTPNRQHLDLTRLNEVKQYLREKQPNLILNAAAYTAVDQAETDRETATLLNTQLPELFATYCQAHGAQLVHYSTDYVYNGTGTKPWQETDPTEPLNHYGQTKLEGDLAIQQNCTNYLILRTSWVYSNRGKNFLNTMLRLAQERTELSIVNDQHGAPTPASYIAQTTLELLNIQAPSGIYHLAAAGETTWLGFAEAIFKRVEGQTPELDRTQTQHYPTPAKRPLNSRLNLAKIEQALGKTTPHWEDLLQQTLKDRQP